MLLRNMVGLLWTSDQTVAKASTYTGQHKKHKRQTSTPSAGFDPAIPVTKRPQTYALDRAATGTGCLPVACRNALAASLLLLFLSRGETYKASLMAPLHFL
jgi:hypothetical protein